MSDYIKREDAINVFCWNEDLYVRCGIATQNIKDIPSADVVEVVRCKDCKKYNMDDCMMIHGKKMNRNIFANDYCSYGEKA